MTVVLNRIDMACEVWDDLRGRASVVESDAKVSYTVYAGSIELEGEITLAPSEIENATIAQIKEIIKNGLTQLFKEGNE